MRGGMNRAGLLHVAVAITAFVMSATYLLSKEEPLKKISAVLECSYESADGTLFRYPGNGTKVKPRIEGAINCWISIKKILKEVALTGKLKANGKTLEAEAIPRPDDTYSADVSFSTENGDFETCSVFTVTGELLRAGKTVWKGKLKIDQRCRD